MNELLESLAQVLMPEGLNLFGVVSAHDYAREAPAALSLERLHPATRSILVVGSGGRHHWERFLDYVRVDPVGRLAKEPHPLDRFCAEVFARSAPLLDGCRVLFPTVEAPIRLDFMKLAERAGLGRPSELGMLVHARFGPWFALRGAVLAPHALPSTPMQPRLCDGCSAPCRLACPPRIVGPAPFPWQACMTERARAGSPCNSGCGAREACIVGTAERYDPLELLYHRDRKVGRAALCAAMGVEDALS